MSGTSQSLKLWYLSHINILAAMSPEDMDYMDRITRMENTPKYSAIYLPGAPADAIYLLKKGRVRISKLSEEGKQIILSILEPGNIFGELSLIDGQTPHETIAEAMEDTVLCIISKKDFEAFLCSHPDINLKVTKLIGLRLRNIESRVEDLVFHSAEERLLSLLQRLSQDYGKPVPEGILISIKLTHQELGELIGTSRQTVSELMGKLEYEGKIRVNKRRIILPTTVLERGLHASGA